jgi:hypothetical protein
MTLDLLLEVITREHNNSVPKEITIEGKPARCVLGFVYLRTTSSNEFPLQMITSADVIYEELGSKRLYKVNAPLDEINQTPQIHYAPEDLRYLLFGSKKLYRAFLDLLNDEKVSSTELFNVFQKINNLFNEMWGTLQTVCFLLKRRLIKDYRKELEQDPLIGPYIEKAKTYLAY